MDDATGDMLSGVSRRKKRMIYDNGAWPSGPSSSVELLLERGMGYSHDGECVSPHGGLDGSYVIRFPPQPRSSQIRCI
jgi:hypothetical protein